MISKRSFFHLRRHDTMASAPVICSSCLRSMQSAARARPATVRQALRGAHRSFAVSSASATVPPTPLLDFLAPSIRSGYATSIRQTPRLRPVKPDVAVRGFSTSASRRAAVLNPRTDEDGNEMVVGITPRAAHVGTPGYSLHRGSKFCS